ncbi:golgin subfamily A member 4-like [Microplitis mediator]|uniref:golgin subfamily A member 4-like n=1 Tax=Microplitis mediator TaxID=375433 RepID=UPI002556B84E|nr:golgin subfamily A member 4-like [Microplitis mediator]
MFKKFKDKLTEEMKQSPARFQAGMQHLAQAVSPGISNLSLTGTGEQSSFNNSNDNFSLTDTDDLVTLTDDRAGKNNNSPPRDNFNFQNVDLTSLSSSSLLSNNTTGLSRSSSVNSVTSNDTQSGLFPIFESPSNIYQLQSDMDQSASEADDCITNHQYDELTKDDIYSAYRKSQKKYHKYRGRFTELVNHYREMERIKVKLETLLVDTQNKALRRIGNLKEQCLLEQQAKAHLEDALRNDMEEKDHIIDTLNTKIKLLQANGNKMDLLQLESETTDKDNDESNSTNESEVESLKQQHQQLFTENSSLKNKLDKFEALVAKYKETLKRSKDKIGELEQDRFTLERDFESAHNSNHEKIKSLEESLALKSNEVIDLQNQVSAIRQREEESAISLAENKLSIHRELEIKEEQIKQLTEKLKDPPAPVSKNTQEFSVQTNELPDNDKIVQELRAELNKTQQELADVQTELQNCNSVINDINAQNNSYQQTIEDSNNEKKLILNNIINCKDGIESLKLNYKNLKQQFVSDYKKNADFNFSSLSQSIIKAIADCSEREVEERNKTKHNFDSKYDELKRENDKLYAEIEEINFELFDCKELSREAKKELEEVGKIKEELDKYQRSAEDKSEEIEKLREEMIYLNEKFKEKEGETTACKINDDYLDSRVFNKKLEELLDIIYAKNDFIEALKCRNRGVDAKEDECKNCLDKVDKLEMMMEIINAKNDFIDKLKCKVRDNCCVIDKLNNYINDLCERNRVLSDGDILLKTQVADLNEKLEELSRESSSLVEENEKLKRIGGDSGERLKEMETEISGLRSGNEELKKNIRELEEMVQDKEKLVVRIGEVEAEKKFVEEEVKKLAEDNQGLKKSVGKISEDLKRSGEEVKKSGEVISRLEEEIRGCDKNIKERDEEIKKRNEEIMERKEEIKKSNDEKINLVNKIDELEILLQKHSSEIGEFKVQIEELKKLNESYVDKINKYEEKMEEAEELKKKNDSGVADDLKKIVKDLEMKLEDTEMKLRDAEITVTNYKTNETQIENINTGLKDEMDKLKDQLAMGEEEQRVRMKQLVKEFQARLDDKDLELQAALDQKFDRQKNYESDLIQQYKEQLKDFQVELTAKSEEIESLKNEQHLLVDAKSKHSEELNKLQEKIDKMKAHADEMEEKYKKEKNKFNEESKRSHSENTSSNPTAESLHLMQNTLVAQRRELSELRKLVKLRCETSPSLDDSTEIEYLRNILYEYMMGKETLVLAKVIAAVVKFDQEQTHKVLEKEKDKLTLLGSLGLTS